MCVGYITNSFLLFVNFCVSLQPNYFFVKGSYTPIFINFS